jgi:hypothetical protein
MATSKKTSSTKKSKTTKGNKNVKATSSRWSWRFSVISIGINFIIVATLVVMAFLIAHFITVHQNQERLDRINGIYSSLKLDDSYVVDRAGTDVFGDKRLNPVIKTESQASVMFYIHADTVKNTVAELDTKIKAAGFTKLDVKYSPLLDFVPQAQYKSSKGEYIHLKVESRQFEQAMLNSHFMDMRNSTVTTITSLRQKYDINAAPSNVVIMVNLDDNNE